jgi:hypothetical protein
MQLQAVPLEELILLAGEAVSSGAVIPRTAATGETTDANEYCAVAAQLQLDWHRIGRQPWQMRCPTKSVR